MAKGIGKTELESILASNPRMVGSLRGTNMSGFLSKSELEGMVTGSVLTADLDNLAVTTGKIAAGAVTSPKLDEPIVRYAEVEISAAEILALFAAPKELVAAPGAGKLLEFISLVLAYDWGTVAYTIGTAGNLQVKYTDGSGVAVSTTRAATGFLDAVADALSSLDKLEATVEPAVNEPLVLTVATASPTAGDSPIHAKVAYRVHSTGL
jgi:energy-converting hydrogenase Eha subunit E